MLKFCLISFSFNFWLSSFFSVFFYYFCIVNILFSNVHGFWLCFFYFSTWWCYCWTPSWQLLRLFCTSRVDMKGIIFNGITWNSWFNVGEYWRIYLPVSVGYKKWHVFATCFLLRENYAEFYYLIVYGKNLERVEKYYIKVGYAIVIKYFITR